MILLLNPSAKISSRRKTTGLARTGAFSLIELLVVIAIVSLLASLSTRALSGVSESKKVASGLSDLSSLLEFAKTEAMSRNTYVRVGFQNQTASGNSQLVAGAIASIDGSTNLNANNIYPLSKVLRFDGMKIGDRNNMSSSLVQRLSTAEANPVSLFSGASNVTFPMTSAGSTVTFSGSTLTITPQGEIMMNNPSSDSPYIPVIELIVTATKGTTVTADASQGALWIYGGSGQTRIFR